MNVGSVEWPENGEGVRILLALQWTYGHVMGWTKPSVFLSNAATLAFTRELAQLKVNYSDFLVFGRLMRPPVLTALGGGALPEARWCQALVAREASELAASVARGKRATAKGRGRDTVGTSPPEERMPRAR